MRRSEKFIDFEVNDTVLTANVAKSAIANRKKLMSFYEPGGTPFDYLQLIHPRGKEINCNFQESYLLFGLASYAIKNKNKEILDAVHSKVRTLLTNGGKFNYPLVRLDQVTIGMTMLILERFTKQSEYQVAINQLVEFVISRYNHDGRVLYIENSEYQHVDALGMYIPFLVMFLQSHSNPLLEEIIQTNITEYNTFGIDSISHLPAHGFNLTTKQKIGSANWGRGMGWYLLGLSFVEDFDDPILNQTIAKIDYTQFPGQDSHFDSSTALMVEIYKRKKGIETAHSLDFIKPYITTRWNVGSCSGDTYTYNRYSNTFTESELCNGLLLYLSTLL